MRKLIRSLMISASDDQVPEGAAFTSHQSAGEPGDGREGPGMIWY